MMHVCTCTGTLGQRLVAQETPGPLYKNGHQCHLHDRPQSLDDQPNTPSSSLIFVQGSSQVLEILQSLSFRISPIAEYWTPP